MPAFKTRDELVAEALTELFADGGSGQSPDAEDRDAVDRKVDGLIEELAARNIVTVSDDEQIPPEWFGPLVELLANECAPRFGRPKSAALREDAEARLKVMTRGSPRRLLGTDAIFRAGVRSAGVR
jgi:hypothetical protein